MVVRMPLGEGRGGGRGSSVYGLDRYVPPDMVFKHSILKEGIIFALVGIAFPM